MTKVIPLTRGKSTIVDDDDFVRFGQLKWFCTGQGYAYRTNRPSSEALILHRLITNAFLGEQVDHINGDKLDNRKCNLRICNHRQNQGNRKSQANNTSGFKGVTYYGARCPNRPWRAFIRTNGKSVNIGTFKTKIEAALAYDDAATKMFGEFALTNRQLGLIDPRAQR